jgi:hypothetical protein
MSVSEHNHDQEFRDDIQGDIGSHLEQDLASFDNDVSQVNRAIDVAEELQNTHDRVASLESYDQSMSAYVMASANALMRVANIGYKAKPSVDLQSHQFTSKEVDLQSLTSSIKDLWRKIVEAIKSSLNWIVAFFRRLFGMNKTNATRIKKLEEQVELEIVEEAQAKTKAKKTSTTKIFPEKTTAPEKKTPAAKTKEKTKTEPEATPEASTEPVVQKKEPVVVKWTHALDTFYSHTTGVPKYSRLDEMKKNIAHLNSTYTAWTTDDFRLDFFPTKAKKDFLKSIGAPSLEGYVSDVVNGEVVVVSSDRVKPVNMEPVEVRYYVVDISMRTVAADIKSPHVGSTIKLESEGMQKREMVRCLSDFQSEVLRQEALLEGMVKYINNEIRNSPTEEGGAAAEVIAHLTGLRFLLNGPSVRYVSLWSTTIAKATTEIKEVLFPKV